MMAQNSKVLKWTPSPGTDESLPAAANEQASCLPVYIPLHCMHSSARGKYCLWQLSWNASRPMHDSPATRGSRLRHCMTPVLGVFPHSLTSDRPCSHGCRVLVWPLKAVGSAARAAATAARQAVLGRLAPAAAKHCLPTDVGKASALMTRLTSQARPSGAEAPCAAGQANLAAVSYWR